MDITFWNAVLEAVQVLPFDERCVNTAVKLNNLLKKKRKQIDIADLFIAATAITQQLALATLNKKHFGRIDTLHLIP